jgi:hypothetical protein
MNKETALLNLPISFETLIALILSLPAEYQQRLLAILMQPLKENRLDYQLFEEWNSEFDNQNMDEYLPEYGMTLLAFRRQQWADEMDISTQMNETEFNHWLETTWKSQIVK